MAHHDRPDAEGRALGHLDKLTGPADLRALDDHELDELATEIRDFLVTRVSRTGVTSGPTWASWS